MDNGKELPQRKRLRLKNFDYNTPGAYFITICTHNRKCTLSRVVGAIHESPEIELTDYGKITDEIIRNIPERYKATVDRYVIMPNHTHLIMIITDDEELRKFFVLFFLTSTAFEDTNVYSEMFCFRKT